MYVIIGTRPEMAVYLNGIYLHLSDGPTGWRSAWRKFKEATIFTYDEAKDFIAKAVVKDPRWTDYCQLEIVEVQQLNVAARDA